MLHTIHGCRQPGPVPGDQPYDEPLGADADAGLEGDSWGGGPHVRVYAQPFPVDPSAVYSSNGASAPASYARFQDVANPVSTAANPEPQYEVPAHPNLRGVPIYASNGASASVDTPTLPGDRSPSSERPPSPVYEGMHNRATNVLGSFSAPLPAVGGRGGSRSVVGPRSRHVGVTPAAAAAAAAAASPNDPTDPDYDGGTFLYGPNGGANQGYYDTATDRPRSRQPPGDAPTYATPQVAADTAYASLDGTEFVYDAFGRASDSLV